MSKYDHLDRKDEIVIFTYDELIVTISKIDHSIKIVDDYDNSRVGKSIECKFGSVDEAKVVANFIMDYFKDE